MKAALLPDRGVVKVAGDDARRFLHNLVTADVEQLQPGDARFGALLTPQGKIVVDFIVTEAGAEDGGGFFLDAPRALAETLAAKLSLYKLRSKVTVADLSAELGVMAVWNGDGCTESGLCYPDPRLPALGTRMILPPQGVAEAAADLEAEFVDAEAYEAHRIALAVPRGGLDFVYGDAFPHETNMDQLGGVDFDKGCFVGQEVVSRMQHRGTARTRILPVRFDAFGPEAGVPVTAGEKTVGTMGSSAGGRGLAILRLDRVADAAAAGLPLVAGGVTLTAGKPDWATFAMPDAGKAAE
jgi:folate-binding protein YgfZ